jgi:hypothetical protein
MATAKEKGDALEAAVASIEELILQTSPAAVAKPIIEKKKIIGVDGVRHEIDVYVTINSASGYESIYIFECKNWQEAVNKNEIIVFAEKIDASKAARGFFVAKAFTSDAEAQAKKDPRIVLLLATEHDPSTDPAPAQLFGRFPQLTKLSVTISVRGSKGLKSEKMKFEEAHARFLGNEIDLLQQVETWSKQMCDEDVAKFHSTIVPAGTYEFAMDSEILFPPGDMIVNKRDIEKITLHIEYKIIVETSRMISHFEVESRGRFFRFAPFTTGGGAFEGFIVFSNPNEAPSKT